MAERPQASDFEAMYQTSPDPFAVATSWYERRKQAVLTASLTQEHYRLAWDAASGTGHLALALAGRCEAVLATDAAPSAVRMTGELSPSARTVVSALPHRPDDAERADLTVVAEVLYYLDPDQRRETLAMLATQRGEIATVHWRHHPHDAWLSGAEVTEELDAALAGVATRVVRHDDPDFVLAVWRTGDDT